MSHHREVDGYRVSVFENHIAVSRPTGRLDAETGQPLYATWDHDASYYGPAQHKNLDGWISSLGEGFKVGLATITAGDTIIYLYDNRPPGCGCGKCPPADTSWCEEGTGQNFGYAFNLDYPYGSEWGYAPFPMAGETEADEQARLAANMRAMAEVWGPDVEIVSVGGAVEHRNHGR